MIPGSHRKGIAHIGRSLGRRQAELRRRVTSAPQQIGRQRHAQPLRQAAPPGSSAEFVPRTNRRRQCIGTGTTTSTAASRRAALPARCQINSATASASDSPLPILHRQQPIAEQPLVFAERDRLVEPQFVPPGTDSSVSRSTCPGTGAPHRKHTWPARASRPRPMQSSQNMRPRRVLEFVAATGTCRRKQQVEPRPPHRPQHPPPPSDLPAAGTRSIFKLRFPLLAPGAIVSAAAARVEQSFPASANSLTSAHAHDHRPLHAPPVPAGAGDLLPEHGRAVHRDRRLQPPRPLRRLRRRPRRPADDDGRRSTPTARWRSSTG